jgi:hypothetical protein
LLSIPACKWSLLKNCDLLDTDTMPGVLDDKALAGLHVADFMVRGRITWDANEGGQLPMLEISWDHFGRMVAGFEGWQFRLEVKDRSEDIWTSNAALIGRAGVPLGFSNDIRTSSQS